MTTATAANLLTPAAIRIKARRLSAQIERLAEQAEAAYSHAHDTRRGDEETADEEHLAALVEALNDAAGRIDDEVG